MLSPVPQKAYVDEADVRRLVRLLGAAAAIPDQARRVDFLLSGLGELIGADGWSREEDLKARRLRRRAASEVSISGGARALPCVTLYREDADRPFSLRELRLAEILLSEAPWLVAPAPPKAVKDTATRELPRHQRRALALLLAGCSRKDLAARLNVSLHTAAEYAKALYKHFGVRSQRELMSRALRALALAAAPLLLDDCAAAAATFLS